MCTHQVGMKARRTSVCIRSIPEVPHPIQNQELKILSNQKAGMRIYMILVTIMGLKYKLCHMKKYNCQEYNVPTS